MHGNVRSTVVPRLTTDPLHSASQSHSGNNNNHTEDTADGPTAVVLEKKPHVPRGSESRAYPPAAAVNDYGGHHELHQHQRSQHQQQQQQRGGGGPVNQNRVQGHGRSQGQGQGQGQGQNQGQGQGRSRGKGKDGPPHKSQNQLNNANNLAGEHRHPVRGGEHVDDNDDEETHDSKEKNDEEDEEEEDEESCFICAEKIKYYSGGVCGHKTCQ
jgi:hypothetical protein